MPIIEGARRRQNAGISDNDEVGHGPYSVAGAPVNGTTLANVAQPGALLIRTDAGQIRLYINTNTLASPTWTVVGTQT